MQTNLQLLAREYDLSPPEIAEILKVRRDTARHWLSGRREVPLRILSVLEIVLREGASG